MRFYSKKAPKSKTEILIDQINAGKCDDQTISEIKATASEMADPGERDLFLTSMKDIALKSGNAAAVAGAIRGLVAIRPMEEDLEEALEDRVKELVDTKMAFSNRFLLGAVADVLYIRISERVDRAAPYMDALVQCLDERKGNGGTTAYNSLMIVAANRPEFFQLHANNLIKMLGSINKATRIQTTTLIAVLAMSHPEYVASAEKTLLHLSSFNPDAELKNSASEAWQILSGRLRSEEQASDDDEAARRSNEQESGGLAEIMRRRMGGDKKVTYESRIDKRLLSMATNFARKADRAYKADGEDAEETETEAINKIMDDFSDIAQSIRAEAEPDSPAAGVQVTQPAVQETSEEAELRKMMDKVKDDFSVTAGSILDAIGMGHLAKQAETGDARSRPSEIPVRDRPKRVRTVRTEPPRHEPATPEAMPKEEEEVDPKEFIASIESIISRTENGQEVALTPGADAAGEVPAKMATADGSGSVAAESAHAPIEPVPEKTVPQHLPADIRPAAKPEPSEMPGESPREEAAPKPARTPIVPSGVRISAMRFKSLDQSKAKKSPTPPKISIKPHIKPLVRTPVDAVKPLPPRQNPAAEPGPAASQGYVICHSCNAKMPEDNQRCAICGADLKSPKVRCRMCGEINPRGAGKCERCGNPLDE